MKDIHSYPGPAMPKLEDNRVAVLGEFGGLGWPYRAISGGTNGTGATASLKTGGAAGQLRAADPQPAPHDRQGAVGRGLHTDVRREGEVNGLMTYDREVVKYDVDMAELHAKLFLPPPIIITKVVVPTSEQQPQTWRYTTEKPADGWEKPGFDDSAWKRSRRFRHGRDARSDRSHALEDRRHLAAGAN